MSLFVGLDVSQRLTHLCVVDADGKRVWRGKCATDPTILAQTIRGPGRIGRAGRHRDRPTDAVAGPFWAPVRSSSAW